MRTFRLPSSAIGSGDGGISAGQHLLTGLRHDHAQNRAGAGEQHRLAEKLTDDAAPPAPERQADADFVPACRAAQHQQVRHVRTHDQRDETGEAEEHREQRRQPLRRTDIERLRRTPRVPRFPDTWRRGGR